MGIRGRDCLELVAKYGIPVIFPWSLTIRNASVPGARTLNTRSMASLRPLLPVSMPGRRHGRFVLPLLALLALAACAPARPPASRPAPLPDRMGGNVGGLLGEAVRPVESSILGAVDYDLPLVANSWVQAELDFLVRDRRDVVRRWMERGDFYEAFVKEVLREHGIPTDLYHVAMIESGFIPTARSHAGAVGMWQFMPATSRDVNLRVDEDVDERMDPVRSTRAAARHLRSLFRVHGDWALAAAAYNAGSTRVRRSMERVGAVDFWDLAYRGDLASETRHYVPRLYAMTIISRDRERFGFDAARPAMTFAFDSIHVDRSLPMEALAGAAGVPLDALSAMNPHLRRGATPDGGYWVWVPAGLGMEAQRAYLAWSSRPGDPVGSYTVRWGDSLGRLAQRTGVPAARIRELNPAIDFDRLQTGATLHLPEAALARLAAETGEAPAATPPPAVAASAPPAAPPAANGNGSSGADAHVVAAGETLWGIAQTYGVTVAAIRETNGIEGEVIRSGQRLSIPGAGNGDAGGHVGAASVEHIVEAGDTLWGIARRYGSSIEAIREANGLAERPIVPGQRLSVPATR